VDGFGLLRHKDLILVGDLNFTTFPEKVWGHSTLFDPLAGFYKTLFQKNCLVDFAQVELVPTWRNGRTGDESIAK
jgi:hypothetical protein